MLWCNAPSRNYFCATKIAEPKKIIILFGLVEMFLLAKGTNPQEEIFLGSKLTEIFFLTKVKLARSKYAYLTTIYGYNIAQIWVVYLHEALCKA